MVTSGINQCGVTDLTLFLLFLDCFILYWKALMMLVNIFGWLPAPSGWVWFLTVISAPGGITKWPLCMS